MTIRTLGSLLLTLTPSVWLGAQTAQVVATGLQAPQKIVLTSAGNVLVSETNTARNAGRISIVNRAGTRRTLLDKLPSGTDVTGGGSGPTALALVGDRLLYVAIGGGDAERRGGNGLPVHNPEGISSPIFTSVLRFEFSEDIDMLDGALELSAANQITLADGGEVTLGDPGHHGAKVRVLAAFPNSTPDPATIYRFSNPWGLAVANRGRVLYLTDASANTVVRIETETGRWSRIARFPPAQNPTPIGPPMIDAVPTSVRWFDNRLLVSFLTGFPFVRGRAQILSVNPETGRSEPFIVGLTSATDILVRHKENGVPQFFTLEFSVDQTATPPGPGRLRRYDTWLGETVLSDLRAPTALAYDERTKELYIVELTGRLLKLQLD